MNTLSKITLLLSLALALALVGLSAGPAAAQNKKRKPAPPPEGLVAERELIVITAPQAEVRATAAGISTLADESVVAPLGDALGAPVEGALLAEIRARFGPEGVRDFSPEPVPRRLIRRCGNRSSPAAGIPVSAR